MNEQKEKTSTWTVKEKALKKGEALLKKRPELKYRNEVGLECQGSDLMMLCDLLKANAIPTTKLDLSGDEKIKNEKERRNEKKWEEMKKWIGNQIGYEGAKAISESLKINTSLTSLILWSDEKHKKWNERKEWTRMKNN